MLFVLAGSAFAIPCSPEQIKAITNEVVKTLGPDASKEMIETTVRSIILNEAKNADFVKSIEAKSKREQYFNEIAAKTQNPQLFVASAKSQQVYEGTEFHNALKKISGNEPIYLDIASKEDIPIKLKSLGADKILEKYPDTIVVVSGSFKYPFDATYNFIEGYKLRELMPGKTVNELLFSIARTIRNNELSLDSMKVSNSLQGERFGSKLFEASMEFYKDAYKLTGINPEDVKVGSSLLNVKTLNNMNKIDPGATLVPESYLREIAGFNKALDIVYKGDASKINAAKNLLDTGRMPVSEVVKLINDAAEISLKDKGFKQTNINQVANFCYLEYPINIKISDKAPGDYFPKLLDQCIEKDLYYHAIPERFWEMDYDSFLEARRRLIAEVIKDGVQKIIK